MTLDDSADDEDIISGENPDSVETEYEQQEVDLSVKKKVRRLLEEKLERKRLKEEFQDDLADNDDFNWDELDR